MRDTDADACADTPTRRPGKSKVVAARIDTLHLEREYLGIVGGVEKFHVFLHGKNFTVKADHQPLEYIHSARYNNSRVLRWSILLMEYDFHAEYIKGWDNHGAFFF